MTPGADALSQRREISLTKILYKREASEREEDEWDHIKGGRDIPAQTRLQLREEEEMTLIKKKKEGGIPLAPPQTRGLISRDLTLPPCANTTLNDFKSIFHPVFARRRPQWMWADKDVRDN